MAGSPESLRPASLPANPGNGSKINFAFANDDRTWEESVDLVALLAEVLEAEGHRVETFEGAWVEHPASGYVLLPQLASFEPQDDGGSRTTSTIQVHHPSMIPEGLFEYQHSAGDDVAASLRNGFEQWARVDLVALLDAARPEAEQCMQMVMTLPEEEGRPARRRRVIFGPIAHYRSTPVEPEDSGDGDGEGNHDFCPCCLLTRSMDAFKWLIEGEGFHGLRLFTMRNADGDALADCRIDGEDNHDGAIALQLYVMTWPDAGFDFRKQYVIIQSIDAAEGPEAD